jgi:hypothetical protein
MNIYGNVNEVVVPMTEGELPEDLRDFFDKDPSFIPEIYSQKFENIMIQNNTLVSTDDREMLVNNKTLLLMENFSVKTSQLRAFFLLMKLNFESFFADHIYWISCTICVGINSFLIFSDTFLDFYK